MALTDEGAPTFADEEITIAAGATSAANPLPIAVRQSMPNFLKQVVRWQRTPGRQAIVRGWYANGQLAVEAHVQQHVLHGSWHTWYANGSRRDAGSFYKGKPHGEWRGWYASGVLHWLRHFDAGKHQAVQIARQQRNPKLNFHPTSVQKSPSDFLEAAVIMSMPAAQAELPFVECLAHGLAENYFENGQLADAGTYAQGLKEGAWSHYNAQHQVLQSGYYLHGQRHGAWKYYHPDGKLKTLADYRHGRLQYQKAYLR
jgi:antitoxin component YwqK of YwqJK toxin-antitoxin module